MLVGIEALSILDRGPGAVPDPFGPVLFLPTEEPERVVYGVPPNLGHADDVYQSLLPEIARANAEGLVYALDGTTLSGTVPVSSGHSHVDGGPEHALPWLQLASWRTPTGLNSSALTGTTVSWTSDKPTAVFGFILPSGVSRVYPRVRWSSPGVVLTVSWFFFPPNGLTTPAVDGGAIALPSSAGNRWYEMGAVDLSSIGTTHGRREVWTWVSTRVNTGSAILWELQLGIRPGL